MIGNVIKYLDMLVAFVKPQQLLFLAIDGVAPRAKMNQQRSRRFISAKEAKFTQDAQQTVLEQIGPEAAEAISPGWDKNVITPGTEFMQKVSKALKHFVIHRVNTSDIWKNVHETCW